MRKQKWNRESKTEGLCVFLGTSVQWVYTLCCQNHVKWGAVKLSVPDKRLCRAITVFHQLDWISGILHISTRSILSPSLQWHDKGSLRYAYNLWFYNAGGVYIFKEEMVPKEVKSKNGEKQKEKKKTFAKSIVCIWSQSLKTKGLVSL